MSKNRKVRFTAGERQLHNAVVDSVRAMTPDFETRRRRYFATLVKVLVIGTVLAFALSAVQSAPSTPYPAACAASDL